MTTYTKLTLDQATEAFLRDGYVLLPQLLSPAEITALQDDSADIISAGYEGHANPTDYFHDLLPDTGEEVFHRVQYVFPKARRNSFLILLAHPFVLELVHHLLGDDFLCAAEALVFKLPGNGREVPVHADCNPADPQLSPLIFNVDYYLDDSTRANGCLYVAPATHKLRLSSQEIGAQGFAFPGLIPLEAHAGDVLFHDTRLVHGSSRNSRTGSLRRTLYYEFQSLAELLKQGGPRPGFAPTEAFLQDRFKLLMHAIDARKTAPYTQTELPYPYQPPTSYPVSWPQSAEPANLRPALGYNKYI